MRKDKYSPRDLPLYIIFTNHLNRLSPPNFLRQPSYCNGFVVIQGPRAITLMRVVAMTAMTVKYGWVMKV